MKRTISAMVGKGSVNHNSRKFKAANVDRERIHLNVDYCNRSIKKVYHDLFDDALKRYNERQARSDRRIENYYEKIRSSKQEKPFHELILQIGNAGDMNAQSENGLLARKILNEYYLSFQARNPNLCVFSAHPHMDEATPHLHIDFVPFTTGSKRGLETRVSLKQALATQGFKGGSRNSTEWNQWVQSEKEQLAAVAERYGVEWEKLDAHENHLSVYEYKKKVRAAEVEKLGEEISEKQEELDTLSRRIDDYEHGEQSLSDMQKVLDSDEYQLPEPQGLITAKSYKVKFVDPLISSLKSLVKKVMARCFQLRDNYHRLNQENGRLFTENKRLSKANENLITENARLKAEVKDYNLLRKIFGNSRMDELLSNAREIQQSQKRGIRSNYKNAER